MVFTSDRGSTPRTSTNISRESVYKKEKIPFTKMSGAGNDFVVVDNRSGIVKNDIEFAKAICDRKWGIGADGVLLIEKSDRAAFMMKYYNSDGSFGGMCGNGGRCISRFAFINHIIDRQSFSFEALDYVYSAKVTDDGVILTMKEPSDILLRNTMILDGKQIQYHFVNTGSPHCVIILHENTNTFSNLSSLDVNTIGRKIRYNDLFSKTNGINVNFIEVASKTSLNIRTYERGVEAETLACGTGSIASAIIAHLIGQTDSSCFIQTKSGEALHVSFQNKDGKICNVTLSGSAHVLFEGTLTFDWSTNRLIS